MARNRSQRRQASRQAPSDPATYVLGWSIELVAWGASIGAGLNPINDDMPEPDASTCIRFMLAAVLVDGARRGWWEPVPWPVQPPPLDGDAIRWRDLEIEGRPTRIAEFGDRHGFVMVQGPTNVVRQLLLATLIGLTDASVRPTRGNDSGGYDERNLTPVAPGRGVA